MFDQIRPSVKPNHTHGEIRAGGTLPENPHGHPTPPADAKLAIYGDASRRPEILTTNYPKIPATLRAKRNWIMWDVFLRKGKWTKEPLRVSKYDKGEKANAKSDDSGTWTTFNYLYSVATMSRFTPLKKFPTVPHAGFVFKAGDGLLGIDVDKCRDPKTGELSAVARRIVAELPGYWEISPSGTGIKGFFAGALPESWKGKGRKELVGDGPEEVEAYDRLRFFAVTGRPIDGATADVTSDPAALATFVGTYFPARPERSQASGSPDGSTRPTDTLPRPTSTHRRTVAREERIRRARGWLRNTPGAIAGVFVSGRKGHDHTYYVACRLVLGFDLAFNDAFDLLANDWNPKCDPPWDTATTEGPDSLYRKLRDANNEPGDRGFMLIDRDAPSTPDAEAKADAKLAADLADLAAAVGGPPDPTAGGYGCGRVGRNEDSTTSEERANSPIEETPSIDKFARSLRSGHLLDIIGKPPPRRPCRHSRHRLRDGDHPTTAGTIDLLRLSCGRCRPCQEQRRYSEKLKHVSAALRSATHIWEGTDADWAKFRNRLDRWRKKVGRDTPFGVCRIIQPDSDPVGLRDGKEGRRLVALAIDLDPDNVPARLGLTHLPAEDIARRVCSAIDAIPYRLARRCWRIKANDAWKTVGNTPKPKPEAKQKLYRDLGPVRLIGPNLEWAAQTAKEKGIDVAHVPLPHYRVEDRIILRLPWELEDEVVEALCGETLSARRKAEQARREGRQAEPAAKPPATGQEADGPPPVLEQPTLF